MHSLREAFFVVQSDDRSKNRAADIPARGEKITEGNREKAAGDSVWILSFRRRGALKIRTIV